MKDHSLSFNAANLTPEEVAENFLFPEQASKFFDFRHFILLGPRGVGKTTLMKALTTRGLNGLYKRNFSAQGFDPLSIDYMPVYIPADALWKGSSLYFKRIIPDDGQRAHILNGIFVYHCIRELVVALESGVEAGQNSDLKDVPWALRISDHQEEKISRLCSEQWLLDKTQTSFLGLKLAALRRLNQFRSAINSLDKDSAIAAVNAVGSLDIVIVLKGFIDIVESILGVRKWSFSFDEMEIAPKQVVSQLYDSMRGSEQRFCLKFSLYPHANFYSQIEHQNSSGVGPVIGQDFEAASMTNKFSNPDTTFSKRLIVAECEKRGVPFHEFKEYMNSGAIRKGTRIFRNNRTDRDHEKIIQSVVAINADRSLIQYYQKLGLDKPSAINGLSENERASRVRKVAALAEFRSYYFANIERSNDTRSRRSPVKGFGYYHGFDQLLVLAEGIPRVVLQHANEIMDAMAKSEMSSRAQNRAVKNTLDRYRALIATQVVQVVEGIESFENALDWVDQVGRGISDSILATEFKSQPNLTFEFNNTPAAKKRLLEIAVSTGAFVADVDDHPTGKIIFEADGVRLRLSHRLAAFYPLPLITGGFKRIRGGVTISKKHDQADLLSWERGNE